MTQRGFAVRRPSVSRSIPYPFSSTLPLVSATDNTTIYRLRNSYVDFLFRGDKITGLRLDKFKYLAGTNYFINSSRKLWELCIRRQTYAKTDDLTTFTDKYYIRPTAETFVAPSVTATVGPNGDQSFIFIWDNIKYDCSRPTRTCKVELTATLGTESKHVELSLKVTANHSIGIADRNVCISAVGMPSISIKKTGSASYQADDFLAVPVLEGQTILNPIKRLQASRFDNEAIQYNETAHKNIFGLSLAGSSPAQNPRRGNFGSPGLMTIPLMIFGNKQDKEGFLYYAKDPDCLHAKNFQFFSDGTVLHLRAYDLSDHEIDPYGMGGKDSASSLDAQGNHDADTNEEIYGNRVNEIGWTIRIRPYASPTVWADWYGTKLYKSEAVPELEALGAVQQSFYRRYEAGELELSDAEMPFINVIFGHLSGDVSDALSGSLYLQELYRTSSTAPNPPKVLNHIQPVTLNGGAIPDTRTGILANYFGWEPWANQTTGVNTGHRPFKSPDYTGVNSSYSGVLPIMLASGQIPMFFLSHSYPVTSGSVWTIANSGIDLAAKSIYESSRTFTNSDYGTYASRHGVDGSTSGSSFAICHSTILGYNKFNDIARSLATAGASIYHDTVGDWGRGCYADHHQYYDTGTSSTVTYSHPRGQFSHFFNKLQKDWLTGSTYSSNHYVNSAFTGLGTKAFSAHLGSELPCDANLQSLGSSLLYSTTSALSKSFFTPLSASNPLYTGLPRTDAVFGSLSSTLWNSASVEAKNWNQLHPMFSIVYGDRCSMTDWTSSWISNYLDVSGNFASIPSGVDSLGFPTATSDTHDHRKIQIKNWIAGHLNHFTRITSSFSSVQYSGVETGWTNKISTMSGVLDSGPWSGLRDYTKKICRLLSYVPDYMYHGTIEHPLESWSATNDSSAYIPRTLRVSRLHNASGWTSGDDTVVHGVRRHRENESVLVWLTNWFSGVQSFSGTFDPTVYEFSQGYNAYSLELNSGSHGTFTNLGLFSRTDTFPISLSIEENDFAAYVFDPVTNFTNDSLVGEYNEQFVGLTVDFAYLRYEYGQKRLSTGQLPVVYEYGSRHIESFAPPNEGFNAPSTQAILNNLPQWMKMRQDVTSTGWQLVNSWGQNLESVLVSINDSMPDKFLTIADTKVRSLLHYTDITEPELLEDRRFDNLLFNSSFSLNGLARHRMPAGWTDFDSELSDIRIINSKSFICPGTVSINRNGKIGQTVYLDNVSTKSLTASIYVLVNTHNVNITFITSVETIDGTHILKQSKITNRSSEWRRLAHTLEVNAQVYRVQFIIISECSDTVLLNAPKLESSERATNWTKSVNDILPFADGNGRFASVTAIGNYGQNTKKINIFPLSSEEEFTSIGIPTRLEGVVVSSYEDLEPFSNNIFGRKVSFLNEVYDTQWSISDNKILLRSYSNTEFDIFKEYVIKDLSYNEELTYGAFSETNLSTEIMLLCVKDHNLFVLCKETYYGEDIYTIKIMKAREPAGSGGYLESIIDFEVEIPINTNQFFNEVEETPTTLAFSEIDPSIMVITTNLSRQFYYKLFYDYYYYLETSQRLYTIEPYVNSKIQVM